MSTLRRIVVTASVALLTLGLTVQASSTEGVKGYKGWRSTEAVRERTAPVGGVYVEGDDIPNPAPAVATAGGSSGEPRGAEQIYNTACMACHASGAAGAPILGDTAAWKPRLAKGEDALWNSLMNGLNAMPAKGMCMDCSEDELKNVLDYMIAKAK